MKYRKFGRSDLEVSPLTLGCMAFGSQADEKESIRIINHAIDSGINLIDTANIYSNGVSETIVGKALAEGGKRDRIVLASKFSGSMDGAAVNRSMCSSYHIIQSCEESLRRLKTVTSISTRSTSSIRRPICTRSSEPSTASCVRERCAISVVQSGRRR